MKKVQISFKKRTCGGSI